MSSIIGIKTADGVFFPILEENKAAKKRLVLTTANDAQTHVQIDLYKTPSMSMANASHIGTLIVENITRSKKGAPSIELVISQDAGGELSATARNLDKPDDEQLLIVSMQPNEDAGLIDFDIDNEQQNETPNAKYAAAVKRPKKALWVAAAAILLLLAALGVWLFAPGFTPAREKHFLQNPDGFPVEDDPPAAASGVAAPEAVTPGVQFPERTDTAATPPPPPIASVAPPDDQSADRQTDASRRREASPVSSAKPPAVIPAGGVKYKVRWGDTLWDVSQAFYRTPWRYGYIARYNGIRNPNHLVAGRTITIPPLKK
jgi:LysM repeat protein